MHRAGWVWSAGVLTVCFVSPYRVTVVRQAQLVLPVPLAPQDPPDPLAQLANKETEESL